MPGLPTHARTEYLGITVFKTIMGTVYSNEAILKLQAVFPNATKADVLDALAGTTSVIFDRLDEAIRSGVMRAIIQAINSSFPLSDVNLRTCFG